MLGKKSGPGLISKAIGGIETTIAQLNEGIALCNQTKIGNLERIKQYNEKIENANAHNDHLDGETDRANRVIKNLEALIK